MSGGGCSVVWFRRDLRVEDNPALAAAVRAGGVVCVFIWAPDEEGPYYPGRVSRWWLKHSLAHLDSSLKSLGASLITKRSTDSVSSLLEVVVSTGATQLFFNHLYDPISLVRDHRAKEVLTAQGIAVRSFNADLLYEPWDVIDVHGRPFTTFDAFWGRCLSMPYDPDAPLLPPKRIISGDAARSPSDTLVFEDESEKGSNALLARAWSPGWMLMTVHKTAFFQKFRGNSFALVQLAHDERQPERGPLSTFEGYKFDPNGEYVRKWLPELARLPTEWIHHPWNAPESVLQAAGIELGSNYPLPIVGIDAAKNRLQEALSEMWQHEAASRAAVENGTEEGLGDSSESVPIAFSQDIQMEENNEPARNNPPGTRKYEDQMVPSITTSLVRAEEEETSLELQNLTEETRAEVPTDLIVNQEPRRDILNQGFFQTIHNNALPQSNAAIGLQHAVEDSTAESSSSTRRERDGGVVPVWSPSSSSYSEQFGSEDNGIGTSSYLQRHPQSHQIMNWRRLSQTG
ncbi:hypothetical protein C1H46_028205 [Malus baccata]|uniref:Photolyase/cryptochrome alpha/beta domain-containing protein n=1 Tax=Malus baccata TaxID=106549 RepID=A0A540LID2_MALBA|nr:hypothetical protein C1H46_028205 [Malus baccata]